MKQTQIERRLTIASEFYYGIFALCPAIFVASLLAQSGGPIAFVLAGGLGLSIVTALTLRYIKIGKQLKQHATSLVALAAAMSWQLDQTDTMWLPPELDDSSLLLVANRGVHVFNYLTTDSWNYLDVSYEVYQKTKNGEYKAATVYYSVLVTKLPRILPNVFFDSKTQRGRQYKSKFTGDQRHSLEGNFDNYFDTYFAEGYTIDDMSFVTPDVMQALIAASDYDIEIVQDRLLMYGPVYVDANMVNDGATKLIEILRTLKITAAAYRDSRLPGAAAAQAVTPQGMFLRRKKAAIWPTIIFITVYIIVRIVAEIKH